MKKRLLLATLTLVCAAAGVCGLAACEEDEHAHTWDEGTVTKAATCTTEGKKTFACTHEGCDETKGETLSMLGHDWDDWETEAATCEDGGRTYRTCKHDESHSEEKDKTQPIGHAWDEWSVSFNGDTGGQASKSCGRSGCDGNQTIGLPALTEDNPYTVTDTADCVHDGTLKYVYTTDGGEEIAVYEAASPAKGHELGAPQLNNATETKKANITYGCECGYKKVYEYDEKAEGMGSAKEAGKTYYLTGDNTTGTTVKSAAYGMQNFILKKGVYEFSFNYLDSKKYTVQEAPARGMSIFSGTRYQVVKDGTVMDKYKDNVLFEFTDGNPTKLTLIVDGTVIPESSKFMYVMLVTLQPGEESGVLMSIGYEGVKELTEGGNTVKITEDGATDDTSVDSYAFTSATNKKYCMTVPENVEVLLNGEDFIAYGTWANFEAKAGVKMVFTFLGNKGEYAVNIGDEKKETIGFDTPVTVTASGKVTHSFADGLEEKEYTVKVVLGLSIRQFITIVFNDPDAPLGGNYTGNGISINLGKGWADTSNDKYSVRYGTGEELGTAYITLTLKGGDTATFIYTAGTGVCEVSLVNPD